MEALLYDQLDDKRVQCNLCNHRCIINDGKRGRCNVRENSSGHLHTLVFERLAARHIDPIEKKPLFHFFPGSLSYSVATVGCNFRCLFCQNSDIAQELSKQASSDKNGLIAGYPCTPQKVVDAAKENNCKSISYTYTEPTIYFEFAFEAAKLAHKVGIKNVFVTNGYMTLEAINMIAPYLDAANVDLKAFSDSFYKELCGAKLEHVKESLKLMKSLNIFVEVTTLVIPGLNDDKDELENLAGFIANSLGKETPWHISRFHPTYKLTNRPPTPLDTLITARDIGYKSGLKYVYIGNVPGEDGEHTYCYSCGKILVERIGFNVVKNKIRDDKCVHCSARIHGVGL
jgi:pyruvate formate lyase activating enzyme